MTAGQYEQQWRADAVWPAVWSMPVKWYLLIREMEHFRQETGMGLANSWGLVHRGQYEEAEATFAQTVARWAERDGYAPPPVRAAIKPPHLRR